MSSSRAAISLVVRLEAATLPAALVECLTDWLRQLYGVDLASAELGDVVVEWRPASGSDANWECQLVVADATEQTRRVVTLVRDGEDAVVFLEDSSLAGSDQPYALVDLPQPLQLLLQGLNRNAVSPFLALSRVGPNSFQGVEPDDLLVALADELAPGLIVAVTPEGHPDQPTALQESLADGLLGIAICVAAPGSALGFAGALGVTGQVRAGSIISLARAQGGLSAQVIGAMSLNAQPDAARRLVLRHQLAAPIPFRLERRRALAAAGLGPGGRALDLDSALELLEEESQRANDLHQRVTEVEFELELAWEEQDTALVELDASLARLRFLERAFRQLGEIPMGDPEPDDEWVPSCCADVLTAARESFPFLVITALEEPATGLDQHQKRSIWAKKIWSALRALNDYGRMKADSRFEGDLTRYREDPPAGAAPLLCEYAAKESESTSNSPALRAIRTLSVTRQIADSGSVYMEQHLKIDKGGAIAPRIHLYDDSGGVTKRVHVGYVGPHLPTSSGF